MRYTAKEYAAAKQRAQKDWASLKYDGPLPTWDELPRRSRCTLILKAAYRNAKDAIASHSPDYQTFRL